MGDFTSFWKKKKTKEGGVIPMLCTGCSIAPQHTRPAQLHGHACAGGHTDGAFTGVRLPVAKTAFGLCCLHLSGRGVAHPSVAPAHWPGQAGPSCRFVRYLPRGRDGRQSKCSTAAVGATGHRFRRSGHRRAQRRETNLGDPTTGACVTGWEQVFARDGRWRRARGVLGLWGARGRGKGWRSLAGVRWLHSCPN